MTLVNPYTQWTISQGWREGSHALPGGGPAIDYAIPHGTTLPSPTDGRVSHTSGGPGGLIVTITRDDGRQIILCHNSEFLTRNGDTVRALDPVARSGNTGRVFPEPTASNPHAGSHLHTYGLNRDGTRWNWTLDAGDAASVNVASLLNILPKAGFDMAEIYLREDRNCPSPGRVWHLSSGHGFAFTSVEQYQTSRNQIIAYREAGATDLTVPPADPLDVPTVDRATLNHFRVNFFGLEFL